MRNNNGTIISAPPGFRDVVDRVNELVCQQKATTHGIKLVLLEAELAPLRRQLSEWVRQSPPRIR
jgi:hypothetical protein